MRRRVHELAIRRGDRRNRIGERAEPVAACKVYSIGLVGTALGVLTAFPALGILQSLLPARPSSRRLNRARLAGAARRGGDGDGCDGGVRRCRRETGATSVRCSGSTPGRRVLRAPPVAAGSWLPRLRSVSLWGCWHCSPPAASSTCGLRRSRLPSRGRRRHPRRAARVWYDGPDRKRLFFSTLVERLESVPGIDSRGCGQHASAGRTRPRDQCGPCDRAGARGRAGAGGRCQVSGCRAISPRCASGCCTGQLSRKPTRLDGPPVVSDHRGTGPERVR